MKRLSGLLAVVLLVGVTTAGCTFGDPPRPCPTITVTATPEPVLPAVWRATSKPKPAPTVTVHHHEECT